MSNEDNQIKDDTWVYVVVQNPEKKDEKFVAFADDETNEHYIPAFLKKNQAIGWLYNLKKTVGTKYEVQAIFYDFLMEQAGLNEYKVHIMNVK